MRRTITTAAIAAALITPATTAGTAHAADTNRAPAAVTTKAAPVATRAASRDVQQLGQCTRGKFRAWAAIVTTRSKNGRYNRQLQVWTGKPVYGKSGPFKIRIRATHTVITGYHYVKRRGGVPKIVGVAFQQDKKLMATMGLPNDKYTVLGVRVAPTVTVTAGKARHAIKAPAPCVWSTIATPTR